MVALALVAATILPFLFPQTGWGGYGMMGPANMYGGGSMMGGFGMPFLGLGMILVPLLFVGLIVVGIVWLVKSVATPAAPQPPVAASAFCIHCGKALQAGWKACPYCGEKVP